MKQIIHNIHKINILILLYFLIYQNLSSKIIEVNENGEYQSLSDAASIAQPGDSIIFRAGVYSGGDYISNLKGTSEKWITITSPENEYVLFSGGSTAFQLSDPEYLLIRNLNFEGQSANGVNIDDGGSYDTPAKHIKIRNCHWNTMNATGNNDMLKMSGVDNFIMERCSFTNGSPGGSGVDMVGCHNGQIISNKFQNQGSNSIQAKGGTSNINIERNLFVNGGARSINIGGSTGLQYFRPIDAQYEASHIFVYSNIFINSTAPIAFVGAVNCEVINNLLYLPDKWAIRILQESTDARFIQCGDNKFINNIIYITNAAAAPSINIGPNTRPESFMFSNNLWYNEDNPSWTGPNFPSSENNSIIGIDPQMNLDDKYFLTISQNSVVKGNGLNVEHPKYDYNGNEFNTPRSIGPIEINPKTNEVEYLSDKSSYLTVAPNPYSYNSIIIFKPEKIGFHKLSVFDILGNKVTGKDFYCGSLDEYKIPCLLDVNTYYNGLYFIIIEANNYMIYTKILLSN